MYLKIKKSSLTSFYNLVLKRYSSGLRLSIIDLILLLLDSKSNIDLGQINLNSELNLN